MKESSKSMSRRRVEEANGFFPWSKIFKGNILDVGAGDDPIPVPNVTPFDRKDGNAETIDRYFMDESFDCIHGSQVLEHLSNPVDALGRFAKLCKKGGHIVITVPEMSLYRDIVWPSKFNPDHKVTFSFGLKRSGAPTHIYVPDFLPVMKERFGLETLLARVVDTNYDYSKPFNVDQTFDEKACVEAWCEFCWKKK